MTVLSQRVASLREQNAAMKNREKNLEDAKEQVRFFNSDLIQRKLINMAILIKHSKQRFDA